MAEPVAIVVPQQIVVELTLAKGAALPAAKFATNMVTMLTGATRGMHVVIPASPMLSLLRRSWVHVP